MLATLVEPHPCCITFWAKVIGSDYHRHLLLQNQAWGSQINSLRNTTILKSCEFIVLANFQCQACGAPSRNSLLKPTARKSVTSLRPSNCKLAWRTTTLRGISVSRELSSAFDNPHPIWLPFWLLSSRLPNVPRPRMSVCILADATDIDRAKQIELEYMSVDDLKKYVLYILSV